MNHVIVIDDDPSVRKGLVRLLNKADFKVDQYTSLDDFMDTIKPGLSGCIILDSRMLEQAENNLRTEFKKYGVDLPFIIISGDDDSKSRQRAHKMNALGFFRKPIDGVALIDAIDWAIQSGKKRTIK